MSTDEVAPEASVSVTDEPETSPAAPASTSEEPPPVRLDLDVVITDAGPCKKHLKVTIPAADIHRQYEDSLGKLQHDAQVPGFRPGRAPRQLIVKRFRKQVAEQVRSTILRSALDQIDQDYKLDPIVQPRLDIDAIELPESGPMSFEMDVEVRPQFDVPNFKGLKVQRPVVEITEKAVDAQMTRHIERYGQIVPKLEGAAEVGDYLTADLVFLRPDGRPINEVKEIQFRLQSELRFQNGTIPDIASKLVGTKPGDSRQVEGKLGSAVEDPSLRGATIGVQIRVNDLKQMRLPELNDEFINSIGFDSLDELRQAVRDAIDRRLKTEQRQAIRSQIMDVLLREAPFDLPTDLVLREEKSTINRLVAELKQEGMSDSQIRASEAQIRANAHESTLRSLKEFLILVKIADAEGIKVGEEDVELEIEAIAARTDESVRRVRARLEKEGGADSLVTQILERRVLDRILEDVTIEDVAVKTETAREVETLDHTASSPAGEAQPGAADEPPAGEGAAEAQPEKPHGAA
jgi:trigger factor